MAKALTPIERFISEIPVDRRRAFDARQSDAGFKRVTVTVPEKHADDLKTFARFLRNETAETISMYRSTMEDVLRDCQADWDEADRRGEL
jgi:hypothetical protein